MQLVHGGDIAGSKQKYPEKEFVDFSSNINPLGMPDAVKAAFANSLNDCEQYPDPLCRELTEALARYEGVPRDRILCGGGAADLIYRAAYALKPRKALLLAPTFAEYELALRQTGCEVRRHYLLEEQIFLPDTSLLEAIDGVNLVVICNPNNPTGALTPQPLLKKLAEVCEQKDIALMVDECFLDFLPDSDTYSLKCCLQKKLPLIILKAFTKIFAMPGLRLGYALFSSEQLLRQCEEAGSPWNVSIPAQLCGIAAAKEREFLCRTWDLIPVWRARLSQELTRLGCKVYRSEVNYILFRHKRTDLRAQLEKRGVLIRDCGNYHGLQPGYYRVAVKKPDDNRLLIKEIEELFSWQA